MPNDISLATAPRSGLYAWAPDAPPVADSPLASVPDAGASDAAPPDAIGPALPPGHDGFGPFPLPGAGAFASLAPFTREEVRLDVDGHQPQMALSGVSTAGLSTRIEWIARLAPAGADRWAGGIWYKDGDTGRLPHTNVEVRAAASVTPESRRITVTYSGGGIASRVATYVFRAAFFRRFEYEIDTVQGAVGVTAIDTHKHSNRPGDLAAEQLDVDAVYRRAGFDVRRTDGGTSQVLPLAGAGANRTWNDAELHDAMQTFWSRFADAPQWALWVLFAERHDAGRALGGVMFDDIGPNHRQGVAIFTDTNIARPPSSETEPDAWVERMKFFTLVHEMGHAFNLAHSWEKALERSWIPLADDPAARSFMNYPQRVPGRQQAFFSDFRYRFTDRELLFLRHAPERFVQMGNAAWFDDHGFRQAAVWDEPTYALEVRVRPEKTTFEFLEPIVLELKLTNVSDEPQTLSADTLAAGPALTVILKRAGRPARQWAPFSRPCARAERHVLAPGASMYESLFVSAGLNGWDLADPGVATVQLCLRVGEEDVVSNALRLKVAPPRKRTEEVIAQDYFSENVGRVLAMDGSRRLDAANDTLEEVATRFKTSKAAFHARVALAQPITRAHKTLEFDRKTGKRKLRALKADAEGSRKALDAALMASPAKAMETLGHIDFNYYVQQYCDRLESWEDLAGAAERLATLFKALASSRTGGRPVAQSVLDAIRARIPERPPPPKKRAARKRGTQEKRKTGRGRKTSSK